MRSIGTFVLVGLAFLLIAAFVSCPTPTITPLPIYNGNFTIDTWNGKSVPYLSIMEQKIYNASIAMDYSTDDKVNWNPCNGSTVSVALSVGSRVWTREQDVSGSERFLGQVLALSGRPDLKPSGKVYPGIYDSTINAWLDYPFITGGQTVSVYFSLQNIGDTSGGSVSYRLRFYLSTDRNITPDDILLSEGNVSSSPIGQIPASSPYLLSATVPLLNPGRYYLGMIVDALGSMAELNEDNNVTTEDQVTEVFIRDSNANTGGAFKFVNSWGKDNTGGWEHKADGHYWVTYNAMINQQMIVYYYYNTFSPAYKPTVLAVFQISGLAKNSSKITLGLGDPANPFIKKEFMARFGTTLLGGPSNFPNNALALDISEFAQYINDFNLYLRIENQSGATGTLNNFQVEFYSDYDTATKIMTLPNPQNLSGSITANATTDFSITTKGQLGVSQIVQIQPNARSAAASGALVEEKPSEAELAHDMAMAGMADTGAGWYGPYRLGLKPPSESEWRGLLKLRGLQMGAARNTRINQTVDFTTSKYFPPIGNQGTQGSCAAWAFGYYVHTYTMAREYNWDLSGAAWINSSGPDGSTGHPSDMQHTFSPSFLYNQVNLGTDGGASLVVAGSLLTRIGNASWQYMPYNENDPTTWPTEAAFRDAAHHRARESLKAYFDEMQVGYFVVQSDADINLLKNLIANGYCVTTGIKVVPIFSPAYPGFFSYLDANDVVDYQSGMAAPTKLDHAQTIVGFKDGTAWNKAHPDP